MVHALTEKLNWPVRKLIHVCSRVLYNLPPSLSVDLICCSSSEESVVTFKIKALVKALLKGPLNQPLNYPAICLLGFKLVKYQAEHIKREH